MTLGLTVVRTTMEDFMGFVILDLDYTPEQWWAVVDALAPRELDAGGPAGPLGQEPAGPSGARA